jgi:hypothetical protein
MGEGYSRLHVANENMQCRVSLINVWHHTNACMHSYSLVGANAETHARVARRRRTAAIIVKIVDTERGMYEGICAV